MLVWSGTINQVSTPKGTYDLQVELWGQKKSRFNQMPSTWQWKGYARPNQVPLWAFSGPELAVYTNHGDTTDFFQQMVAADVGLIATVTTELNSKVDHMLFYATFDTVKRIWARPLSLTPARPASPAPETTKTGVSAEAKLGPQNGAKAKVEQSSSRVSTPEAPPPEPASISVSGIDGPRRALQQTILGALRLRGVQRHHPDYKLLYHHCLKAAEFSLRNHPHPIKLDVMREKVEALLAILEPGH